MSLLLLLSCDLISKGETTTFIGRDTIVTGDSDVDTDTDVDTETTTDTETTVPSCEATVLSVTPADGEESVAPGSVVVATFSEPVEEATIGLEPSISGTVEIATDGLSATFTPDTTLDPDTDYVATAEVCEDTMISKFHTSAAVSVDLSKKVYRMDLTQSDITWSKPAGLGPLLLSYIVTKDLLFMVEDNSGGMLDVVGVAAISQGGNLNQYVCTKPIDFDPIAFTNNPSFEVGPATAQIQMSGAVIDTYDATVSGTFELDGTGINDTVVSMLIDSRDVYSSFGVDVCSLLTCVNCPDGTASCVELEVMDSYSPEVSVSVDPNINPADYPDCN